MEPRECQLDHPPVNAKLLLRLDASACNARCDAPVPAGLPALPEVIPLVRVELLGPPHWPPSFVCTHGRERTHQALEHCGIVPVRGSHPRHQRNTPPIHDQMMFTPSTSPICRIRPRFQAPFLPECSRHPAKLSTSPAFLTPAAHLARRVLPWNHVFSTKRMPVNTARSGILHLPVPCRGSIFASTGSMCSDSPDSKISLIIHLF